MAQRDAKKAYQSRMQQQERLAIRYLKIGQSSQCPYYKGIKIIFQNYRKKLNNVIFHSEKREDLFHQKFIFVSPN
ncbi:hypothetical protein DW218_05925 [Bacteroides eggerthii]|nr:hypothetical protein DW218_05925 [Bacteroides eggerthii]